MMPETNDSPDRAGERERIWQTDLVATILLGLAAVGAGWAAYQSATWNSEAFFTTDRADVVRRQSALAENRVLVRRVMDVGLFTTYLQALNRHDTAFARFLFQRFPPELNAATTAWLATKPLKNAVAPPSPFAMREYRFAEDEEARRLNDEGQQILARAREENKTSDHYVLVTVPFAVTSLFAGISSKFRPPAIQRAIVAMGLLAFVGAVVALLLMPVA
jgi:hypothetical protein